MFQLNNPGAIGMNAMAAFQQGREARNKERAGNAMLALARNPQDQSALTDLGKYDAPAAAQMINQQRQQQDIQSLAQAAMAGDEQAKMRLMMEFPKIAETFDQQTKTRIKRANDFMGQALFDIQRAPPEQHAALWSTYVQRAEASGIDVPQQYETYSPEAMRALSAEAGLTAELMKALEPKTMVVPQGGTVYEIARGGIPVTDQQPTGQAAFEIPDSPSVPHMALDGFARLAQSLGPQRAVAYQRQHNVPVQINSAQDYARLPKGALFLPPEGGPVRVKP